jgi:hypothetical protein
MLVVRYNQIVEENFIRFLNLAKISGRNENDFLTSKQDINRLIQTSIDDPM